MDIEKIFVLYGKAQIGKTTTLNVLIDLLRIVSDSYEISKEYEGYATFKFSGKTISVCTPGDDAKSLEGNIDYFKKQKCNIAVTATRVKGAGKDLLDEFAETKKIIPVRIHKDDNTDTCRKYAAKLFELVTSYLEIEVENLDE